MTGDARRAGGDCGLCDGVDGRERAFVELGESFEACESAILVFGSSILDMVSMAFPDITVVMRAPAFSFCVLLDIRELVFSFRILNILWKTTVSNLNEIAKIGTPRKVKQCRTENVSS